MDAGLSVMDLGEASGRGREVTGGKAGVLAELAAAGFPVPPGFVVTTDPGDHPSADDLDGAVLDAAERIGPGPYAVRSSAVAEDLADASYAGLYETFLNIARQDLVEAIHRCLQSAHRQRVTAYRSNRRLGEASEVGAVGMAVLVQQMVDPVAAGVAFTANPITGSRDENVVTAVRGMGEQLVSGEGLGEEWTIRHGHPEVTRQAGEAAQILEPQRAVAIADLASRVAQRYGRPQDIEWAIDHEHRLHVLQARPMTALPEPVAWDAPGPGFWMRNFRLGEWLPEAMTPLFATWLLPRIETGYLDGMRATVGTVVPFPYAAVNGWYYNALPTPTPGLLGRVITQSRGRAPWFLFNALVRVSRNPVAADRAILADLEQQWRTELLPGYRRLVERAEREVDTASPQRLVELVEQVGGIAGQHLWSLAIVGGSAWKMEACLTAFCRDHQLIPGVIDTTQVLLRGLPGTEPGLPPHAVQTVDWYRPTAGEITPDTVNTGLTGNRHRELAAARAAADRAIRTALGDRPRLRARCDELLEVTRRYTVVREEQARDLTLGWPLLRRCAHRLGEHLTASGTLTDPEQVFFLTYHELTASLTGHHATHPETVTRRQHDWDRQRRLIAPLTLGTPSRFIGDPIARAANAARTPAQVPQGAIVGQPASAGRATGPVRLVTGPDDFDSFTKGEVLVAKATAPAWTPLFAGAVAVVTDGGTMAAHASLVAREYGIPAVVGTGDATTRLRTGQLVTVDGGAGIVYPSPDP